MANDKNKQSQQGKQDQNRQKGQGGAQKGGQQGGKSGGRSTMNPDAGNSNQENMRGNT